MLKRDNHETLKKIVDFKDLDGLLKNLSGKKLILVGGCFDIFHYGHLTFLQQAGKIGDRLIVLLESDEFIKKRKHRQPVHSQTQRAEILAYLDMIDVVIKLPFFKEDSLYSDLVEKIRPMFICVTEGDSQLKNKKTQAKRIGSQIKVVCKLINRFSSTSILKKLCAYF